MMFDQMNDTQSGCFNLTDIIEERVSVWIWRIVSPLLFLVGTLGNILVIVVVLRMPFRRSSTLFYMLCLAVTDLIVIFTGLTREWIRHTFDFDIRSITDFGCKFHLFTIYTSMDMSSWILVTVTMERFVCVYFPLQSRIICTVRRSILVLIVLHVIMCLLNLHFFFTNGLVDGDCKSLNPEARYFDEYVFVWFDLSVLSLVPFVVMLVCNAYIVNTLLKAKQEEKAMIVTEGKKGMGKVTNTTRMLMMVNAFFLVTTLPISIYFICDSFIRGQTDDICRNNARLNLGYSIVYLIQYSNNCLNFYLYTARGCKFRSELMLFLKELRHDIRLQCASPGHSREEMSSLSSFVPK